MPMWMRMCACVNGSEDCSLSSGTQDCSLSSGTPHAPKAWSTPLSAPSHLHKICNFSVIILARRLLGCLARRIFRAFICTAIDEQFCNIYAAHGSDKMER